MSEAQVSEIVSGPEGLTAEWFTSALRDSGALAPDAAVKEVALDPVGEGVMARSSRATLSYDPEGAGPTSLVAKYATDDPGSLGVARAMRMYELETSFYRDVAPIVTAHVPQSYFASHDSESGAFTLLLEDLGPFTRPGDVLTLATPDEARAVLTELVGIQAPTWNSPRLLELPWLADPAMTIGMFDHFSQGVGVFVERFGEKVSDEHLAFFERILPKSGQWARSWSPPTVLQHGDFRTDNIMWGKTDADPAVTIIDFQTARLGPPGVDPAYFLGASLSVEDRRASDQELIHEYHAQLLDAGVKDFDFDACWQSYREGALYGVLMFVGTAGSVESTERADRLIVEQITRYASMAIDLQSAEAAGLA
jgi:aminoglycoside/choline kinase family phosphotransferase